MAKFEGYGYIIDKIREQIPGKGILFENKIRLNNQKIESLALATQPTDALPFGQAQGLFGSKASDNIWTGTNIFNGYTEFGNVSVDKLTATNIDVDNLLVNSTTNFFSSVLFYSRASFVHNQSNDTYNIIYRDRDMVVRKSQNWSHILGDNCEVIGGDIGDRIGNSLLSVLGNFGVSGTSIFNDNIFVKADIKFNEGGSTDPHIGWSPNTINAYSNDFEFFNTLGTQNLATICANGIRMYGREVYDTSNIKPLYDNTYNLGSTTKRYKNGYFAGDMFIGSKTFSGDIKVMDSGYNSNVTINIPAPDTGGETIGGVAVHTYIQNIINSLPKYIPSENVVKLKFSAGTYKFSATNTIIAQGFYGGGKLSIEGDTYSESANSNQNTIFEDLNTNTTGRRWRFISCSLDIDIRGIRFLSNATESRPFFWGFYCCSFVRHFFISHANRLGNTRSCYSFCEALTKMIIYSSMFGKCGICSQGNHHSEVVLSNCVEESSANKPAQIIFLENSFGRLSPTQPDFGNSKVFVNYGALFVDGARTITTDT